ncbi:MAG: DUF5011 domain-containing protein [Bacteroidia bacterium]|nr:DUF5011 domain-containing protein [Bacteroidia bacterium]
MKKLLFISSLSLSFIINSPCKKKDNNAENETKKDTTPPVITLKGQSDFVFIFGYPMQDPGAIAMDETYGDLSGNISSTWNSEVDVNNAAVQTVVYTVSDKSGNKATASRKVTVKLMPYNLHGEYNTTITQSGQTYTANITTLSDGDNPFQISISPFFGPVSTLKSDLSGETGNLLTVDQSASGVTAKGGGEILENAKKIVLTYTISTSCSSYPCIQTMTKK